MPLSRPPDRRMPAIAALRFSPDRSPAVKHRAIEESPSSPAKTSRWRRDRNCRSCSRETAPADDHAPRARPRRRAILPDTAARIPRDSPNRYAPALSRKPRAPTAKSRLGSNTFFGVARALPESTVSFFPSRYPAPPRESVRAASPQFLVHIFPAAAHPRVSIHTLAERKSSRTARSPLRHTNISREVLFDRVSSGSRAHQQRIQTRAVLEGQRSAWRIPALGLLVLDATECRVDVGIMGLEPVSERPPQHARSRAGRATLHYVVLAVEEIGRVTRIERHRRETRKRRELRPRPFPSVSHKVVHAKCAGAGRMRANRRGI